MQLTIACAIAAVLLLVGFSSELFRGTANINLPAKTLELEPPQPECSPSPSPLPTPDE